LRRRGRLEEAATALAEAADIEKMLGNERGQLMVLTTLSMVLGRLKRTAEAISTLEVGVDLAVRLGDATSQCILHRSKGIILHRIGKWDAAKSALERSLEIAAQGSNFWQAAKTHAALGRLLISQNDVDRAIDHLRDAFWINVRTRDHEGIKETGHLLSSLLKKNGGDAEGEEVSVLTKEMNKEHINTKLPSARSDAQKRARTSRIVKGTIDKLITPKQGSRFGFVKSDDQKQEIFFTEAWLGEQLYSSLSKGTRVAVEIAKTEQGRLQAKTLSLLAPDTPSD
jgi:tetratricopeptide (TPR) repeat protein